MHAYYRPDFQKILMILNDQKTKLSICLRTSGQHFHTFTQKLGWEFEIFRGNQKLSLMFEKLGHMFWL